MKPKPSYYRFDDVMVDLRALSVLRAGSAVQLERKAFEVLVFLIEHRGRAIQKTEILDAVWKESYVTENALTRVIAQLRRALGDDPREAKYIRTVQTLGYLFLPDVEACEATENAGGNLTIKRASPCIESLAVLPLENISGDPSHEYFADAMTDELITELAKIGALRVISRTSSMQYKRARKSLPEIARELNVDAVVEGSALRSGNRVRITAQLIDGTTDSHLWAESYERDLSDILSLQKEVARAIAGEIKIKLTPQEQSRLEGDAQVNPDACECYLKGVYYFHTGRDRLPATRDILTKSFDYFERAIRIDPRYAAAHAALASSYRWLAGYGVPSLYSKAKASAVRAIDLDDTIAEAHAALGYILFKHEWDWTGAEREYLRAIELSKETQFLHGYAMLLSAMGRHNEAIEAIERAEASDPLSFTLKANIGLVYMFARRFDQATEKLRKVVEMDPAVSYGRWAMGQAYAQKGEMAKAIEEFQEANRFSGSEIFGKMELAYALALAGETDQALELLEDLSRKEHISPYLIAIIYAGLGEREETFVWLEKACRERAGQMTLIKVDPRLDDFRSDPRFADLVQRVGLAE